MAQFSSMKQIPISVDAVLDMLHQLGINWNAAKGGFLVHSHHLNDVEAFHAVSEHAAKIFEPQASAGTSYGCDSASGTAAAALLQDSATAVENASAPVTVPIQGTVPASVQEDVKFINVSNNEDNDNDNAVLAAAADDIEATLAAVYLNSDGGQVAGTKPLLVSLSVAPVLNDTDNAPMCLPMVSPIINDDRWYTVTVRRQVGIFQGLHFVTPITSGVMGMSYCCYKTQATAITAFATTSAISGVVRIVT
ncbi:hypothetical protein C0995_001838 [Termitomyces sp. Mi166|nr:hypothetical protein C0995_001838 [Termitomyces sp. Mi166\